MRGQIARDTDHRDQIQSGSMDPAHGSCWLCILVGRVFFLFSILDFPLIWYYLYNFRSRLSMSRKGKKVFIYFSYETRPTLHPIVSAGVITRAALHTCVRLTWKPKHSNQPKRPSNRCSTRPASCNLESSGCASLAAVAAARPLQSIAA